MSKREPSLLLGDMLESANRIFEYTLGYSFHEFINDPKTVDAVIRNFEIIGEAANRLPQSYRVNHPLVEWQKIRGLRNRIVHDYFGIDYAIVWQIKETYLKDLLLQLEQLRAESSDSS